MPITVYSTQTNGTKYAEWSKPESEGGLPRIIRFLNIAGGANLVQKRTLITPHGVGTEVTAEQYEWLMSLPSFQKHINRGFIRVVKTGKPEANKVAADMEPRDGASPTMPQDLEKDAPKIGEMGDPVSELTKAKRPKVTAAAGGWK